MKPKPYGIMFHHFSDKKHPKGQGAISADQLADIIEYLGPKRFLPAGDWMDRAIKGNLKGGEICLTFDDALLCQYDIALPVLQHYKMTAFWFVYTSVITGGIEKLEVYRKFRTVNFSDIEDFYTDFYKVLEKSRFNDLAAKAFKGFVPKSYLPGSPYYTDSDRKFRYLRDKVLGVFRYNQIMDLMISKRGIDIEEFSDGLWMREEHIRKLKKRGHIIGSHSHTHPTMIEKLSPKGQKLEYETTLPILSKILGETPRTMSHPCNSYNKTTLKVLRDLGFIIGFRANMVEPVLSELEYPRQDHANIMKEMAG